MSTAAAQRLTAILHREEEVVVAECPEVGTVSQGDTVEEALANLREATDLFLEECPQPVKVGPALSDADRQLIDQRLESFLADGDPGLDADAVLDALFSGS
jgi:predicted RNase H-like HicB family nuclease